MDSKIPSQHRALQLESTDAGFQVVKLPTPHAGPGSAIIRIEAASILSYHRDVYNGARHYSFPTPLVGGISAIGRIAALGPDATSLSEGQLVYVDCVIRARDDPDTLFLSAIHDSSAPGSVKLMRDVWRDGTFAEYAKFPLENCLPLNEPRLCKDLGYSIADLTYMSYLIVPFGGLRDIKLEPGETVVVTPATGGYGGAGVLVALAMGARVIAGGRSAEKLAALKEHVLAGSPHAQIDPSETRHHRCYLRFYASTGGGLAAFEERDECVEARRACEYDGLCASAYCAVGAGEQGYCAEGEVDVWA
jgi:NADPH:quinone reductase-like Zn-dependent oxidoreductase